MTLALSILVVEDNLPNRILMRDVLSRRGHTVAEAADVAQGLACLRAAVPDLVLLDIALGGESGETLLQEIRRTPATAHLPVIAVTAFAMPQDRARLLAAGFDDYFTKPISVRSFAPDVEAVFERVRKSLAR